jgi:hypothetical protein
MNQQATQLDSSLRLLCVAKHHLVLYLSGNYI